MADLAVDTVAEQLRDRATRSATLTALESHAAPIPTAVSLAAAPALLGLMTMDAAEVERDAFDRAGLLLGQLYAEAVPDVVAVHGAAFGERGYERLWNADSVVNTALRQPVAELTHADATSYACSWAYDPISTAKGLSEPARAAGLAVLEFFGLFMSAEPIYSKKKQPEDDVPTKMLTLLIELLKANELPKMAIGGAWAGVFMSIGGRPSLGPVALEHSVVELAVEHLKAIGSPADWVSISRGKAGRAQRILQGGSEMCTHFSGEASRPDLVACVASGLFDLCLEAITAVAAAGVDGLQDAHRGALYSALSVVRKCRAQPGCEGKIRSAAGALAFCLMNDLDYIGELGLTTAAAAASICCGVFGRDEGGSGFSFSAQHVETLLTRWSQLVRADGYYRSQKPTAETIMALELCISDANKPLLLAHRDFLPYVVDALLLDADHPRADMKPELKSWCQQHHAECLAQLAVFAPARETLRADPSVIPALEAVAEGGLTAEARQFAEAALLALSEKELHAAAEGQKHVMLSYQWNAQATVMRINESLIERGYVTWFDLTNMKGSTMDAMSDAIEGADVMLYGVSLAYKESANCRMEANYAHQQELDMIPLMMQKDYSPKGWLGLILGTRMWYGFWGADQDDDAAFDRRLGGVLREVGDRGKLTLSEAVPPSFREPTPAPAPAPTPTPAPAPAAASALAPAPPMALASTSTAPATLTSPATPRTDAPQQSYTPSMQQHNTSSIPLSTLSTERHNGMTSAAAGVSLMEVSTFMTEQLKAVARMEARMDKQAAEAKAEMEAQRLATKVEVAAQREIAEKQRHEMEAQMEEQRREMEQQRQELEAKAEQQRQEMEKRLHDTKPQRASEAITEGQLEALQARVQTLHEAKLLSEDELVCLEDIVADCIEVLPTADVQERSVQQTVRMSQLSEKMAADVSLARQLRRKFT